MRRELKAEGKDRSGNRRPISHEIDTKTIVESGIAFGTIMKSVSESIASAAKGTGTSGISVLESISSIVRTALRGSSGVGSDFIMRTKAIMMGVIRSTGEKENAALKILSHTARTVIRQTAAMKGDVGAAVTGLVRGTLAGAEYLGVDPAKAAWAVSGAAIEEAYVFGSLAAARVRGALKRNIGGIDPVPSESLQK